MFWGMTLEPGKLYTEVMGEEVQLSMAAIDSRKELGESPSSNFCQIVIQTEKGEYVLCTLVHGVMFQQSLDLKLMPREKVTFSVQGPSVVYLVGYTASYPEDEEEMRMQQEEYEEDSSAWETFEEEEIAVDQIKQDQSETVDDSDTDVETDTRTDVQEVGVSAGSNRQTEGATAQQLPKESGEEIIFPVAEIDQPMVKVEPSDTDSEVVAPSRQELPSQGDIDRTLPPDQRISLSQTGTTQDLFYPETQQPLSNIQLAPQVPFQPSNSGPNLQQQNPQLPPMAAFSQALHRTPPQRSHTGPLRHSSPRQQPTQRTYPSPRKTQPTTRARRTPQPMNVQQVADPGIVQQQAQAAGPSQMDVPGPSNSGIVSQHTLPHAWPPIPDDRPPYSRVAASQEYSMTPVSSGGSGIPPRHRVASRTSKPNRTETAKPFATVRPATQVGDSQNTMVSLLMCRFCHRELPDPEKLRLHEHNHSRTRRFVCPVCHRAFIDRQALTRHERTHTGERPFKCQYCEKTFTQRGSCTRHEATHFKTVFTP